MELEPEDGCGNIALAGGLTAVGRGPFLRVSDKRVSRNHGLLEVVDEKLRIKPLHTNPCFYRSSSGHQLLPLAKDKWHWLNPGDSFSLLPDKYIFKVISPSFDQTLRNSDLSSFKDDEQSNPAGSSRKEKGDVTEGPDIPQGFSQKPTTSSETLTTDDYSRQQSCTIEPNGILQNVSKSEQLKSGQAPLDTVQRKRILPAWMLQVTTEIQNPSTVSKKGNAIEQGRGRGRGDAGWMKTQVTQPGRKRHESGENVVENEASDQPQEKKGRRRKTQPNKDEEQGKNSAKRNTLEASSVNMKNCIDGPSRSNYKLTSSDSGEAKNQHGRDSRRPRELSDWEMSDKEEEEEVELVSRQSEQETAQTLETPHTWDKSSCPDLDEAGPGEGVKTLQTVEQNKPRRAPCMYGSNCYRKNPLHFQELSHPGDTDYEELAGEEEDDDKPECPFGTACYRKNPQHKKEYKHTRPPGSELRRPKRKVAQKDKSGLDGESDDDGEPNRYDLNDRFIDDEEEDLEPTDEDSDWEPSADSDEDIETLTKEANRFGNLQEMSVIIKESTNQSPLTNQSVFSSHTQSTRRLVGLSCCIG
ncbi:aprataxin and PNK-like factor isoform X3 [Rhincodon typus]|uniref:aprataxin and PNK-like factor isoform X3 n=1 Tax=Rhincodon typus TaxID=259920 RepID=UPI002030D366|nr:aprataxin and PNK-like factor isoform X3 [Rhincodon typus]